MKRTIFRESLRVAKEKNTKQLHPEWGNWHHFSFVIQDKKIIEYGTNREGSPPPGLGYAEFGKIHSEFDAFRKAKGILDSLKPFEIINIRLNKQNKLRMSAPCNCCYNFLSSLGNCKAIYYSTNQQSFKKAVIV